MPVFTSYATSGSPLISSMPSWISNPSSVPMLSSGTDLCHNGCGAVPAGGVVKFSVAGSVEPAALPFAPVAEPEESPSRESHHAVPPPSAATPATPAAVRPRKRRRDGVGAGVGADVPSWTVPGRGDPYSGAPVGGVPYPGIPAGG